MTYFRIQLPVYYRRRSRVSRLCSEWEKVGPRGSNHRNNFGFNIQLLISGRHIGLPLQNTLYYAFALQKVKSMEKHHNQHRLKIVISYFFDTAYR